ncbi:MAG: YcaO-like family protein [Gemmatimonadaceae bacterium]|nr:YcaO-like family protein [Gemmatimonadaceae bacterium]
MIMMPVATATTIEPASPAQDGGRTPPVRVRGERLRAAKGQRDGTHRTVSPAETFERIRPHLPSAGITRLADVTGLDRIGLHTVLAYRPNSPTLSNASGKGMSLMAATVSGAMEGLELHHAENLRLPVTTASWRALADRGPVLPLDRLPLIRNAHFSPAIAECWVDGWDLMGQEAVPVPWASVSMLAHPPARGSRLGAFPVSSNGLAAGNHLLEATCAALLELVERDAIACHCSVRQLTGRPYPKVDLGTVTDPHVLALLDRLEAARTGIVLYDVTADTGVPVYVATLYDRRDRHVGIYGGYGAHLDPSVAMLRAMTEAAQSRLIYIAGSRDDFFRHQHLAHRANDGAESIRQLEAAPATVAARVGSAATDSFEGDVHLLLERLRAAGLAQAVLVDLTHEEIGVPVARVVVPGLDGYPFHAHYQPGARVRAFAARAAADPAAPLLPLARPA